MVGWSRFRYFLFAFGLSGLACSKLGPPLPADEEILDGPLSDLTSDQNIRFLAGDRAFNDQIFTVATGLGPLFVATSCGSCHAGDGKGHPFSTLTRFGQSDSSGNKFLNLGGPQLQHRATSGYQPEILPIGASFAKFTPPANTGLGYLDAVPDQTILTLSDPDDQDKDGISGRPNWVKVKPYLSLRPESKSLNDRYIGRFGKKAATYDLLQQTATAYNQDIGITSIYEAKDVYSGLNISPEISETDILNVVFYLQTLKAPLPRLEKERQVGKELFVQIGCAKCHVPEMRTGESNIAALSNKTFFPYTDLLLHDMGPALDDGYTEGFAKTYEWRTPPLWGLGLSKNAQGGQYYLLHDGRAGSIQEAILLHEGEAKKIKLKYQELAETEKNKLILFLESL